MRLADFGRYADAVAASTEAVTIYRELAAAHPDTFTPDLAGALSNHSSALAALGRHEDALAAGTEAVTIYRELAAAHPDAFTPDLAKALRNQSERWRLSAGTRTRWPPAPKPSPSIASWRPPARTPSPPTWPRRCETTPAPRGSRPVRGRAGRQHRSRHHLSRDSGRPPGRRRTRPGQGAAKPLRAARGSRPVRGRAGRGTEALDTFRRLAAQRAVYVPDVARSLVVQGLQHAESGDFADAVAADREAVSVYTPLISSDPNRYRDGYEQAIQSLTAHLERLGRTEQEIADELDRLARGD